jgi:hypothetical protein
MQQFNNLTRVTKINNELRVSCNYCSMSSYTRISYLTDAKQSFLQKKIDSTKHMTASWNQCLPTFFLNPFQSNFPANRILPSSYLFTPFIPAIFVQAQPREYNAQSPVCIKTHGLPRNRKSTTCAICWPKSVLHEEKRQTGSNSGTGAAKTCRTSSDIGAEQENHVGRGPT